MARTTKQKWVIGCLSAAGALVVLSGLAILAFFKVMDILKKVPPESTQIVLYNDTNEQLRIDRIDYREERVMKRRSCPRGQGTWQIHPLQRNSLARSAGNVADTLCLVHGLKQRRAMAS